jgi:hypothetical protein
MFINLISIGIEINSFKKKSIMKVKNIKLLTLAAFVGLATLNSSCNKDLEQFSDVVPTAPTGITLDKVLQGNPDDSLYYKLVVRGGQLAVLADSSKSHTIFATNNSGIKPVLSAIAAQVGVTLPVSAPDAFFAAFISQLPPQIAGSLVQATIVPQSLKSSDINPNVPNYIYPTILNPIPTIPNPTPLGAVVRIALYPSTRNGAWLNNVPLTAVDQSAYNGFIHHTATLVVPSQKYLWDRISNDAELTFLKAAVNRADSGVAAASSLQGVLSTFGPDLTVFAPVDSVFKIFLVNALQAQGVPAVLAQGLVNNYGSTLLSDPGSIPVLGSTLAAALSPTTVKGLLVYHVIGKRLFTNNFPTTATNFPTLLNTAPGMGSLPGLKVSVGFTSPFPFATSVMVDDASAAPAAHVIINSSPLLPDPIGTSDQTYLNGVLHKIDAVLSPM